MKNISKKLLLLILLPALFLGLKIKEDKNKNNGQNVQKITTNDLRDNIAINQINMLFYNNGIGSYNNQGSGSSGLYWPGGINAVQTAVFEDGLIFGAKVGTEIRVGGSTYRAGLQAGPMLADGTPANPNDPKYKIWKIRKGWESLPAGSERDRLEYDYNNWPVEDGAPWVDVNGDGVFTRGVDAPDFIGDEVNWMVMNDGDPSRTTFLYGTQPMGLEIQCTIFGFNRTGALGDMVFKKYKFINKGNNTLRDMVVAYWSDPDLGDANDDFNGCDTTLSIGYIYNGDNNDAGANGYGAAPPALAYDFFQGPIIPYDPVKYPIITQKNLPDSAKFDGKWRKGYTNLPLTSFAFYINGSAIYSDPDLGVPQGSVQMYNYMTSKLWDGQPFIDPTTGQPAQYCLAGDPVNGTGWYEGAGWPGGQAPGDRRFTLSSGPFTMAPGDTQEVVVGILIGRGTDNINSIKVMKEVDAAAQLAYDLDFNLVPSPSQASVTMVPLDRRIVFHWADNAESYSVFDPLLGGKNLADTTYDFEGYEVYQYKDIRGTDPILLATYDKANGITKILDWQTVQGENVLLPVAAGNDGGLKRVYEATIDKYTNKPFNNGTPYYFGVVSYGYSPNSAPKVLKTTHAPIEVYPQADAVGTEYTYNYNSTIPVTKSSLANDGVVAVQVVDPNQLTGHTYKVFLSGSPLRWGLLDQTTGDTLLKNQTFATLTSSGFDFLTESKVIHGFVIKVADPGSGSSKIKEVVMTKNAGVTVPSSGNVLPYIARGGQNVFGISTAGSRGWWIAAEKSNSNTLENLNYSSTVGVNDFELRFTSTGSEFYSFYSKGGLTGLITRANPKGKNTVPFEAWNIGDPNDPSDDKQLYIKINDEAPRVISGRRDSIWSGNWVNQSRLRQDSVLYEEIYFYNPPGGTYVTPLPAGVVSTNADYPIGSLQIAASNLTSFPAPGTVIRISTWKPLKSTDSFTFTATKPKKDDIANAKSRIDEISVYPNPYFGANSLERDKYQRFVRFTKLPTQATIRIYTLAGTFVQRIDKNSSSQYVDWNLLNRDNIPVASGIYLAYIDIPGVGTKILKIAVIQETPYIDRL